ncbi:hypothetical protein M378DRAFT_157119 [Amanita muscaria Koide BX008]|uniref:Inositol polyphosphate-related phosphatase domain-containing protein n=1 Tax=Amanita muscaria (strain Koide BX008) TaxID=946122 RepID=A0A0C2X6B7_AMAMK|nr:hypothetical protein M378DRAFT_157119 [Amanita muscaria Koide BX008]
MSVDDNRLLVQIASYNTNLQGLKGIPQDLVDWLSPTLHVSKFLTRTRRAPDIVAVGFQELLPLHLGFAGLSSSVIDNRNVHILSQIEAHAPNGERYSLIAKEVNVGVALLVYGRDDGVARRATDVQNRWTGCGPAWMGNKGAVGIRFRVPGENGEFGETFTFVCAHLTAHAVKLQDRVADYRHIVRTLLFPPLPLSNTPSTIFDSSHLFFFGDLNFRLDIPPAHPLRSMITNDQFGEALTSEDTRVQVREYDQLTIEKRKSTIFVGLHEGEFWKFKCSYKYLLGEVDKYDYRRVPAWTDRVLFASHGDSPDEDKSKTDVLLYTSIPSYTTSDHKPVVCLLHLPAPSAATSLSAAPLIHLPATFTPDPDPFSNYKRYLGRTLDRILGIIWWLVNVLGAGNTILGIFNILFAIGLYILWRLRPW